jgi:hypothetical protein
VFFIVLFLAFWQARKADFPRLDTTALAFEKDEVQALEEDESEFSDDEEDYGLETDELDENGEANEKGYKASFGLMGLLAVIGEPTQHSKLVAFQTPSTPIMEGIIDLHHDIMFFLVFVIVFVMYLMGVIFISSRAKLQTRIFFRLRYPRSLKALGVTPLHVSSHNTFLEIV